PRILWQSWNAWYPLGPVFTTNHGAHEAGKPVSVRPSFRNFCKRISKRGKIVFLVFAGLHFLPFSSPPKAEGSQFPDCSFLSVVEKHHDIRRMGFITDRISSLSLSKGGWAGRC